MKKTLEWAREYDVVVAGYGGSGIAAAIAACDKGAKVIILEKAPYPAGGQTRAAGLRAAFATDPVKAAEYLFAVSSKGLEDAIPGSQLSVVPRNDCLVFMQEMANNPAWLTSMSVQYGILNATSAEFMNLPGAECFGQISIKGFGVQFLDTMKTQIEKRSIEVLFATPALELVQDPETREIRGLIGGNQKERIAIKARKGVVLCTGGFEFEEEMKANYLRPYPLKFCGWPYNTGDGIKMAQMAGADLWHMNTMVGYATIWPPGEKISWIPNFGMGIWVNKYGKRYTNEEPPFGHNWWLKHFDFNLKEPGYSSIPSYMIFDEMIRKTRSASRISPSLPAFHHGIQAFPVEIGGEPEGWSRDNLREVEKGWIMKAGTIEELGEIIGGKMDPAALKDTVTRYNRYCELGHDPDFGRQAQNLEPVNTPPFYACTLYPGGVNTCGGPRRNAYGQVLDPYKRVIPRLYSAGEMGSICGNIYPMGGLNAGEMMASGRLAGRSAASLDNWE
jgi:succinate dehydrogenase/fumarate reductase flavoprotein subunit